MAMIRSFLRSFLLFVRQLAGKASGRMRLSSGFMAVVLAAAAAVIFFYGPASEEGVALAAPMEPQARLETVKEKAEGILPVTEAKIQFGLFNTNSQSQELAGTLLAKEVQSDKRRRSWSHAQLEVLQQQIAREKAEEEAKRLEEEKRRAARRIPVTDDAMVVELMLKRPVRLFYGAYENIKITTPEDLEIAEVFLKRTGKTL